MPALSKLSFYKKKAAESGTNSVDTGERAVNNGRRVGLEDPSDVRLQDDPNIFPTGRPDHSKAPLAVSSATAGGSSAAAKATELGDVDAQQQLQYPAPVGPPSTTLLDPVGKAFIDPRLYGGMSVNKSNGDLGEPLNVIVSALSSPEILTRKGLQQYLRSLDLDMECFGLHSGALQKANLDPRGFSDELFLYREVYTPLDHLFGTCVESLIGGNHIRVWQQQGTGAWFFAASEEENVSKHHKIIPNGYDLGRDKVVGLSQKNKNGITSWFFTRYQTKVQWLDGLMPAGAQGINHDIAVDGRTALLTIKILNSDDKAALKKTSAQLKAAEKEHKRISKRLSKQSPDATVPAAASANGAGKDASADAAQPSESAQASTNEPAVATKNAAKWLKRISTSAKRSSRQDTPAVETAQAAPAIAAA
ncbi:hypothetical protein IE81DRAFT_323341 [Ceraceosorus guamensis]|uniref:Uncharacterized protein n=1 Tax=Ceraceosorus guamensis TaxID=1522189 RepID=A0A316W0C8_9BASI|nr:hypothetical protein IE81DRAFT_323341 [Ceraceosorus guamensis]PWN42578.1 hypothetical protein IE81DRAFT_323341 [Ceraceosorus guamensis]